MQHSAVYEPQAGGTTCLTRANHIMNKYMNNTALSGSKRKHLSNATCLTHALFKSGEECSKLN